MQQDNIDAFTGGVRPDGLKNKSDIKVLVCFLLRHCTQQLSRKEMTDIFLDKGLANYFEVSDAISSLVRHENIMENTGDGTLMITESGRVIADTLYDALPLTIREKSLDAMSKLINRRHVSKQNKTRTYNYATVVRDRFLDDPETLYRVVMAQLTDTPQIAPKPKKPVIKI